MGMALYDGATGGDGVEWETDRARFIGRGRTLANPLALSSPGPLSGTLGNVLDPLLALRRTVELQPGASVRLVAVLTAGTDRQAVESALTAARIAGAADRRFPEGLEPGAPTALATPPPRRACPAPGVDAIASAREDASVLQRPWGVLGQGRRIRHPARPFSGRAPPASVALDQCHRQPSHRLRSLRKRVRVHLEPEQPRESPYALVQRPGLRPRRRGALHPR